jgi:hypothetical protein
MEVRHHEVCGVPPDVRRSGWVVCVCESNFIFLLNLTWSSQRWYKAITEQTLGGILLKPKL